jgi:hypothetical protein
LGFEAEGETIDESADALATACFLGTDHHACWCAGRRTGIGWNT